MKVDLTGVSETALPTRNARVAEARRSDSITDRPMAIALIDSIDVDFAKLGRPARTPRCAHWPPTNRCCPNLELHPTATVVAQAEGLQTSFWRLDAAIADGQFRWSIPLADS